MEHGGQPRAARHRPRLHISHILVEQRALALEWVPSPEQALALELVPAPKAHLAYREFSLEGISYLHPYTGSDHPSHPSQI